jgi:hypothetical protein
LVILLLALAATACARVERVVERPTDQPTMRPTKRAKRTTVAQSNYPTNPFGILVGLTSPERVAMVKELRVAYFRAPNAITADKWDGIWKSHQPI